MKHIIYAFVFSAVLSGCGVKSLDTDMARLAKDITVTHCIVGIESPDGGGRGGGVKEIPKNNIDVYEIRDGADGWRSAQLYIYGMGYRVKTLDTAVHFNMRTGEYACGANYNGNYTPLITPVAPEQ